MKSAQQLEKISDPGLRFLLFLSGAQTLLTLIQWISFSNLFKRKIDNKIKVIWGRFNKNYVESAWQ